MAQVGIYFVVNKEILIETTDIQNAISYGDFLIGKQGHDDIWEKKYRKIFHKDYDYYPRGRVVYNRIENKYILYADQCISQDILNEIVKAFELIGYELAYLQDNHYVCWKCNEDYIDLDEELL